jgi:hypothetical protein
VPFRERFEIYSLVLLVFAHGEEKPVGQRLPCKTGAIRAPEAALALLSLSSW